MKADRDINKLTPLTRSKLERVLQEIGHVIFITEGYRSQQRQEWLYAQ